MYVIVRHFRESGRKRTIKTGLTLAEAQAHCRDPETSSRTAKKAAGRARTRRYGDWFDIIRGCCAMSNGLAPVGWVEIQRDDSPDHPKAVSPGTDAEAAQHVARIGGAPGTAMLYSPDTGAMIPLHADPDEPGVSEVLSPVREALERVCREESPDACPAWIAIVPEYAARKASSDDARRCFDCKAPCVAARCARCLTVATAEFDGRMLGIATATLLGDYGTPPHPGTYGHAQWRLALARHRGVAS